MCQRSRVAPAPTCGALTRLPRCSVWGMRQRRQSTLAAIAAPPDQARMPPRRSAWSSAGRSTSSSCGRRGILPPRPPRQLLKPCPHQRRLHSQRWTGSSSLPRRPEFARTRVRHPRQFVQPAPPQLTSIGTRCSQTSTRQQPGLLCRLCVRRCSSKRLPRLHQAHALWPTRPLLLWMTSWVSALPAQSRRLPPERLICQLRFLPSDPWLGLAATQCGAASELGDTLARVQASGCLPTSSHALQTRLYRAAESQPRAPLCPDAIADDSCVYRYSGQRLWGGFS
mmetsp:Transcript_118487/g.297962  ORF Transcript_118487/g.297962 Transcript_118487/m.297962 type:complete len:282 (-) Transcript_118487:48-893(-)